ncbi:hypothetical protein BDZ91DRAFT_730765 [Kalaharituber pfeilii]|nr:hypothetical protein BDZ91DRAFT_730765 [Kalaharituber pfeilii]
MVILCKEWDVNIRYVRYHRCSCGLYELLSIPTMLALECVVLVRSMYHAGRK